MTMLNAEKGGAGHIVITRSRQIDQPATIQTYHDE
jgi:hypothetical protein